jgi:hypothetical protein
MIQAQWDEEKPIFISAVYGSSVFYVGKQSGSNLLPEAKNPKCIKTELRKAIRAPSVYAAKKISKYAGWPRTPKILLGCAVEK